MLSLTQMCKIWEKQSFININRISLNSPKFKKIICACIHTYPYMHTHVKTPYIIPKLRRGAELKKVCIKQQKSLFHYQQKNSKHPLSWDTKLRRV